MPDAAALRIQIEAVLADRIPSALTPLHRTIYPVAATGIDSLDRMLEGGLPVGAITEVTGPECSGRTSLAVSYVARLTHADKVCAWVDASDTFDPEGAAAGGLVLSRLLWVRCGVARNTQKENPTYGFALPGKYLTPPAITKGLHGGGFGPHPRGEIKGLSVAISSFFLHSDSFATQLVKPQRSIQTLSEDIAPAQLQLSTKSRKPAFAVTPWASIEQALRVTDLLLPGGGFSAIVLDLGSIAPEYSSRVPMATWFRYRAAAERTQASLLLLNQSACAKSSAGLALQLQPGNPLQEERTVYTGMEHISIARRRFTPTTNVVSLRKPPQRATEANWRSHSTWAGRR